MNFRKLLIYAGFATVVTVVGCKKNNSGNSGPTGPTGTTGGTGSTDTLNTTPYSIVEDFETGSKGGYAAADINLITGSWNFNDALIGSTATDVKDGLKSVRLRTGDIAMNFDISGLKSLIIKHAKYGTDANSTWQLLESTDGGATWTQVGTDINETSKTLVADTFKVTVTTKVRFEIKKAVGTTRVNIDDVTFKGIGDPGITIGGNSGTPIGPDTTSTSSATTPRGVTVGTDAPPATGDNSNLLFGNPSGATPNVVMNTNYLIDQGYYVESYNSTTNEPNWVSWHLDATSLGSTDRLNNFAAFSGLPGGYFQVQSNSYSFATYGFDRGHNCPSADRTTSVDANSSTFLMTNMIPQAPQNNEKTWADLENYLREQVVAGDEVYIIMGSYGTGGTGNAGLINYITAGNAHINVPSNVWKIAVILPAGNSDLSRVTATTRVLAVNTPNTNAINADWKQYIVTVKDIETATGYNLLSALPTDIQTALKSKKDAGD
jgi:endonuclease G